MSMKKVFNRTYVGFLAVSVITQVACIVTESPSVTETTPIIDATAQSSGGSQRGASNLTPSASQIPGIPEFVPSVTPTPSTMPIAVNTVTILADANPLSTVTTQVIPIITPTMLPASEVVNLAVEVAEASWQPNPALFRRWEVLQSGVVLRLHQVPNINLASGQSFTAWDLKELLENNKNDIPSYTSAEVLDDFTIDVTFSQLVADVLFELSNVVANIVISKPSVTSTPALDLRFGWHLPEVFQGGSPLENAQVREALELAIDEVNIDLNFHYYPNWPSLEAPTQVYDPAKARDLLAQAGYTDGFAICVGAIDTSVFSRDEGITETVQVIIDGFAAEVGIFESDSCIGSHITIVH